MSQQDAQPEPIEQAMLGAARAQRAGVFARTPVPRVLSESTPISDTIPMRVNTTGPRRWVTRLATAGLSLAACVALLFVWRGDLLPQATTAPDSVSPSPLPIARVSAFQNCFAGPGRLLSNDCRAYDYDADGDVDLLDFGRFQRAFADTH